MSVSDGHHFEVTVFGEVSSADWAHFVTGLKDLSGAEEVDASEDSGRIEIKNGEWDTDGPSTHELEQIGVSYIIKIYAGNEAHSEYAHNSITVYDADKMDGHSFLSDGDEPIIPMSVAVDDEKMAKLKAWYTFYLENKDADLTITDPQPAP